MITFNICLSTLICIQVLSDSFHDDNSIKTKGRLFAEYLSKYSWYCSENVITKQTQNRESTPVKEPNLDDGWNFFEHISLPRCFQLEGDSSFTQAEPGKTGRATTFYPLIKTPVKDLADFGVGVGSTYFKDMNLLFVYNDEIFLKSYQLISLLFIHSVF